MVDIRPLFFANALFLMLLITAGFAHINDQEINILSSTSTPSTSVTQKNDTVTATLEKTIIEGDKNKAQPEIEISDDAIFADEPKKNTINEKPVAEVAETKPVVAVKPTPVAAPVIVEKAAPVQAAVVASTPKIVEKKKPVKAKPKPVVTTGKLIIRSNVEGDTVLINGKPHGPTRLVVDLAPGSYSIEVAKNGFSSWKSDITVRKGDNTTLKARLEHYTTVDYRDGEWINGITTGEGTYLADDGTRYEGGFVNGKFHGIGNVRYTDSTEYRGEWFEGNMQGDGTLLTSQGDNFVGIFKDNEFNGEGTLTKANGDIYTGYWVNGSLNGQGSLTTKDGLLYVGGFSDNQFHGDGSLTYPDGRYYEGSLSKGQFHGKGIEIYANGKKYAGQFMEGQYHGKGEIMNPNGSKITGTFKFGQPFGKATLTTPQGEIFTARTTEPGVCYRLKSYRATQCPPMEGW